MSLQLSTKYAADVEQSIRSMSVAAVYGKRSVAFTGDSYVGTKVSVIALISPISFINIIHRTVY